MDGPLDGKLFWGAFFSATSRAKVVDFRPSSGSGRRLLFHRRLDICKQKPLQDDSYWPKTHFLPIITPKPAYIYPNNFLREIFSKKIFGPMGPPWGTWGPYLRKPSVEYFANAFF